MKHFILLASIAGLSLISFDASASHKHRGSQYDNARVVGVDPILVRGEPRYEERCWVEQSYGRHDSRDNRTSRTVLGGIVGAAIGNQIGSGDGRRAATAAGAVIGASIGHNSGRRDHRGDYYEHRRCETVHVGYYPDRVVGYHVDYEYYGRIYNTRTDHHPGRKIRIHRSHHPRPRHYRYDD